MRFNISNPKSSFTTCLLYSLGALGTWTLCGIWAVKWHCSLLRMVIHTHGLRGCVAAYMCAGCHTQMKTEQCILALRQSWFWFCIFWGYVFFYSMAFLLIFLFLTTIHPYESSQGKVKPLGDGVSARTLRLWVVGEERKCVLSLPLVAEAIPICHVWAANLMTDCRLRASFAVVELGSALAWE